MSTGQRCAATVAVFVIAAAMGAGCTQKHYPLDSNGWSGGPPARGAHATGAFHAVQSGGTACAWIGSHRVATLWPKGWSVSFHPTELLDSDAKVVAQEGDTVTATSSTASDDATISQPCNVGGTVRSLTGITKP